jgi:hypothetical protein
MHKKKVASSDEGYCIRVYVDHGFYSYVLDSKEQAIEHGQVIMSSGVYRHSIDDETVAFYPVKKVKVLGPDIGSAYLDRFERT